MTNRNCLTCGWGVRWTADLLDPEHISGLCQWESPVPMPKQFGHEFAFSVKSLPEEDCPAWKPVKDAGKIRQGWAEHPRDYQKRVEANFDRLFEEFEQREKLRTQCLCCINEPEWGEPRRFGFQSGTCRAGKKLERHRNDILVEGNFLESTCPAWQPKEATK